MMLSVVEGVRGIAFDPKLDRDGIGSISGWKLKNRTHARNKQVDYYVQG